ATGAVSSFFACLIGGDGTPATCGCAGTVGAGGVAVGVGVVVTGCGAAVGVEGVGAAALGVVGGGAGAGVDFFLPQSAPRSRDAAPACRWHAGRDPARARARRDAGVRGVCRRRDRAADGGAPAGRRCRTRVADDRCAAVRARRARERDDGGLGRAWAPALVRL